MPWNLQGLVFDYYVDDAQVQMVHWDQRVPTFTYSPDTSAAVFVPTMETTRLTHFLDTLIARKHHVMFVGNTGMVCPLPGCMQLGVSRAVLMPLVITQALARRRSCSTSSRPWMRRLCAMLPSTSTPSQMRRLCRPSWSSRWRRSQVHGTPVLLPLCRTSTCTHEYEIKTPNAFHCTLSLCSMRDLQACASVRRAASA